MSRAPVPDQEVPALKALIVGLCVLLVMTPAVAAANGQQNGAHGKARKAKSAKASSLTLEQKLAVKVKAARKYRSAIRFFQTHRSLAQSSGKRAHRAPAGQAPSRDGDEGGPLLPDSSSALATPGTRRDVSRTPRPALRSAGCSGGTATRPSRSRGASPVTRRPRATASTSACSRWASGPARSRVTATRRTSRPSPRTSSS